MEFLKLFITDYRNMRAKYYILENNKKIFELTRETCFFLAFGSCLTQFMTDENTFSSQSTFNRVEDMSSST